MRGFLLALGCAALSAATFAAPAYSSELAVDSSPRPAGRPIAVADLGRAAVAAARVQPTALRPAPRPQKAIAASLTRVASAEPMVGTSDPGFRAWVRDFRSRALRSGVSARTFDRAFRDAQFLPSVIEKDRHQSEFTKSIWDYLDSAASDERVANGRAALRRYGRVLDQIQARYGVDKSVVVAIWGMESNYGTHRGTVPIISALATLSYEGRRARFFETQLIDALKIIQHGDVSADDMTGSWAGAMGHTQFIPSSYLAYAVDFRGDGRRDIWSDDPTDALASTAAYLARSGWRRGQPWGIEVSLPRGFNYAQSGHSVTKSVRQWAALGVRPANGGALRDYGSAELLLPAGARGAAFLVFHNFHVIGRYNAADAYVIGVGYLASRIAGGPPIRHSWPRDDRALSVSERVEMQQRLTRAGFNTGGADGKVGPMTVSALRAYQRSVGMIPDGYASLDVLRHLR